MTTNDTLALRPTSLAHVVFKTSNFHPMLDFWTTFLGATRVFENDFIAFLSYDEEHHRVAIINQPGTDTTPRPATATASGLHHVAFTYSKLANLLNAYQIRQRLGIKPMYSVNHGPTTSIYYQDPDGNTIETQVDNFDTVQEANEFMASKLFAENPVGTDIDPDELLGRLEAGEDEKVLKIRVEIGARSAIPSSA